MPDAVRRRLVRRLVMAQVADGATFAAFALLVGFHGPLQERNPLIAAVYALGGIAGLVALKFGAALLMEYRARSRLSRPITHAWYWPVWTVVLAAATASGIAGSAFNLAALVRSL